MFYNTIVGSLNEFAYQTSGTTHAEPIFFIFYENLLTRTNSKRHRPLTIT